MKCIDDFHKITEGIGIFSVEDNISSSSFEKGFYDGIYVDLTTCGITKEYFERIDSATSNLVVFFNDQVADSTIVTALNVFLNEPNSKNIGYENLKLCLLIDTLRCFIGLDHSTNINTPEGLAILILLTKIYYPYVSISYDFLKEVPEFILSLDGLVPYIGQCSAEIGNKKDEIIISRFLFDINPNADIQYRILLYNFCEAVAKADDIITISEKEWLMSVLRLDDEDINNDINIDSIFH